MSEAPGLPPEPAAPTPTSALFGSIEPRNLGFGTAIEVAFKAIAKPAFIGPLLVIAIVINAIIEITLGPVIARYMSFTPGTRPTIEDVNAFLSSAIVGLVVSTIGAAIAAIYGTIWAVAASIGPFPTVGETLRLAGRRWPSILGAGLLVGIITLGMVAVGVALVLVLSQASAAIAFGVAVGLVIVFFYVVARLYMTPWLAADGNGVVASLQGSWRMTENGVLRIIGWTIGYGLLFALLASALGLVLGRVPYVGAGIGQGLSLALTYAAGVTLYRRTQASASPPAAESSAPSVTDTPIG